MAPKNGNWMFIDKGLCRKREVVVIAGVTGRSRHEVAGLLLEFWAWADGETVDGRIDGVVDAQLSHIVGADETFWCAVRAVGWLQSTPDGAGLVIPNFERWMGKSAKSRILKNLRQTRLRDVSGDSGASVDAAPSTSPSTGAPPYKRRKEKSNNTPLPPLIEESARRVVKHYQATVRPKHPAAGGAKNVSVLLKGGLTEEQLVNAANGYAAWCAGNGKEPQYRLAVRNFYGQAAGYQEYLDWAPTKTAAEMTPEEQEARRREWESKPYTPG